MDNNSPEDVKEAEAALHSTEYGKRIFIAENMLRLATMGYLPRLKNLLLGARHQVRHVQNLDAFRQSFDHKDKAMAELDALSSPLGYVASTYTAEGVPYTTYYCTKELSEEVVSMLTSSIAKQHAVTLAAIGLDVEKILGTEHTRKDNAK